MSFNRSRLLIVIASIVAFLFICVFIILGLIGWISLVVTLGFIGAIVFVVGLCIGGYFLVKKMKNGKSDEEQPKTYDILQIQQMIVEHIAQKYKDRFEPIQVYPEKRLGATSSPILRIYGYCSLTKRYCNVLMNIETKTFGELFSQNEAEVQREMEGLATKPIQYHTKIKQRHDPVTGEFEKEEDIPFFEEEKPVDDEVKENG